LVRALPTRLMQVFSNLFLNAYQAMHGNGCLIITLRQDQEQQESSAVVEVLDTGPGIRTEHTSHVFEPFFTTGKGGSGLGLYICKTIIEDLGGSISFSVHPKGEHSSGLFSLRVENRLSKYIFAPCQGERRFISCKPSIIR